MMTALCLYGHFRCFDKCWDELNENLIKPNSISHIFAMAWVDSKGYFQHPSFASIPKEHPGFDITSEPVYTDWLLCTLQRLKPTQIHLDNYHLHDMQFTQMVNELALFHHPEPTHRPKGTLSQVWARCTSLKLAAEYERQNRQLFDRIVCTRWDIGYRRSIMLDNLDPTVVSMDGMYGPTIISDAWACGPSTLMRSWSQQFRDIPLLVNNGTMNLGPHEWLKAHFDYNNITWSNRPDIDIWIKR
jgi:hypothetical protein